MIDAKEAALQQMDRIALLLKRMESVQKDLQLEYWRYQAQAYPVYECNHPDTHFCNNCFEEAQGPHD